MHLHNIQYAFTWPEKMLVKFYHNQEKKLSVKVDQKAPQVKQLFDKDFVNNL